VGSASSELDALLVPSGERQLLTVLGFALGGQRLQFLHGVDGLSQLVVRLVRSRRVGEETHDVRVSLVVVPQVRVGVRLVRLLVGARLEHGRCVGEGHAGGDTCLVVLTARRHVAEDDLRVVDIAERLAGHLDRAGCLEATGAVELVGATLQPSGADLFGADVVWQLGQAQLDLLVVVVERCLVQRHDGRPVLEAQRS